MGNEFTTLLDRLKKAQQDLAMQAMTRANIANASLLLQQAGMVQGLGQAIGIVNEVLREQDKDHDRKD